MNFLKESCKIGLTNPQPFIQSENIIFLLEKEEQKLRIPCVNRVEKPVEYPKLGSDPSCVAVYLGQIDFNNHFRFSVKKILMSALGFLSALCPHWIIFYLFTSLYFFTCQESCSNISLSKSLKQLLIG